MTERNKLGQFVKGCSHKWFAEIEQKRRKKISKARKGTKFSEEHKRKLKETHKGKRNSQYNKQGKLAANWKGGKTKTRNRWLIYKPEHPFASKKKYILQYRLIMEQKLGRYLNPEEVVHHINGKKDDDRLENLYLFPNQSSHMNYERNLRLTYKRWI